MAKTAVGGDDDRPKKFTDKIKNSPAAKMYKEEGAKKVAKTLGGMAADIAASAASKAGYHLGLTDNPSQAHAANAGMRDRGGVKPRTPHFVSSYNEARGTIHGECVGCALKADEEDRRG